MSSSFITAMNTTAHMATGVNGSDVYTEMTGAVDPIQKRNEPILTLFSAVNRNMSEDSLTAMMNRAFDVGSDMELLTTLAFHVRDIEEGKGERTIFYNMFRAIIKRGVWNVNVITRLVELIPKYGSWMDLVALYDCTKEAEAAIIRQIIICTFVSELVKDTGLMKAGNVGAISLAGKWAPREGKKHHAMARAMAQAAFPTEWARDWRGAMAAYRKMVVALNAALKTTETYMCHGGQAGDRAHHFADIDPGRVASRCLKIKRRAFFNEPVIKKGGKKAATADGERVLRFPEDADRNKCREHFTAHVQKALSPKVDGEPGAVIHGKRLMPHEFVMEFNKLHRGGNTTENDRATLQAQWNDMRDDVLQAGTLGKTVVMADFSGSMGDISNTTVCPMHVSFGLGLLCAECTSPAFRNYLLTFNTQPKWHDLTKWGENALFPKMESFLKADWGGSTNFEAAYMMILDRLIKCRVPVGEEPDIMLVITDMGWDSASQGNRYRGGFNTHVNNIKAAFKQAGGWKVPTILIWNVSGDFKEFHHESTATGVCTISGWSPAILKTIMTCPTLLNTLEDFTPFGLLLTTLNGARYDDVRAAVRLI